MTESLRGRRVAIANRAEIAVRIATTCRRLDMIPVLLAGEPDLDGYAARSIGLVEPLGSAGSEMDVARVVAAARRVEADLLHPGYGFLSERAELSAACDDAGICFVGPSSTTLELCGDKLQTRLAAQRAGVPLLPASPPLGDEPTAWHAAAEDVGYPLLVKPAAAGGGRGMRRVVGPAALVDAIAAARREGGESGAGDVVYLERELAEPRHVEVQLAGDGFDAVVLGDRDCSLQRRHQKVVEEAPAPGLSPETRAALHTHAVAVARAVGLRGVATCEFLLGGDGLLAFLEVNPRLQVEHPVTEVVTGLDLVEWQFRLATGEGVRGLRGPAPRGHAIEARVYAEDPAAGFLPSPGRLATVVWPTRPDLRVDAGYALGDTVPTAYDPLIAKFIGHGADRDAAIAALSAGLREVVVAGVTTNVAWLLSALAQPEVAGGRVTTATATRVPLPEPPRAFAIAAAVARALDRPPTADPWMAVGPFRVSGETALLFHGDDWEERAVVWKGPGGWMLRIDGAEGHLRWWRDVADVWTVTFGRVVARAAVIENGGVLDVASGGGRWRFRPGAMPARSAQRASLAGDGRIRAPLPGKVLRVDVAEGDHVVAGASLVTLSAMKIELGCSAPAAGTVGRVRCTPGQLVDAGEVLVEMALDGMAQLGTTEGTAS